MRGAFYRQIRRVYSIFFLDGVLFPGSDRVPRRYYTQEEVEHDRLGETAEILFYELPKLDAVARGFLEGREDQGKSI